MSEGPKVWARGLHHASDLLIRRGTAMGPLVPMLFLIPFLVGGAYLFRQNIWISAIFILLVILIVTGYFWQYSKFANSDPDRLQSEEYRYEMTKIQMVAAKELPTPMELKDLNLSDPSGNPANPMPPIDSFDARDISKRRGGE